MNAVDKIIVRCTAPETVQYACPGHSGVIAGDMVIGDAGRPIFCIDAGILVECRQHDTVSV